MDHDITTSRTVKLLGKTFEEVYLGVGEKGGKCYYNKKYGIIGFEDHNEIEWALNVLTVQKINGDNK